MAHETKATSESNMIEQKTNYSVVKTLGLFLFTTVTTLTGSVTVAADYYVSVNDGSDSNSGSESSPFATMQHAHDLTQPGDTVYVKNGIYRSGNGNPPLHIRRNGREDAWITFRNYPGHRPKIEFDGWTGLGVWASSYIEIAGFEIEGNLPNIDFNWARDNKQNPISENSGTGIGLNKPYQEDGPYNHHIRIRNNIIHDTPGNGISSVGSDYLFIQNNLVYRAGWYAPWGMSGISSYEPTNSDDRQDVYRHIISDNISHSNYNYFECFCSGYQSVTDGNGIIVDDGRHEQGDTSKAYNGRVLVTNNVVFNNGARGINVYLTDKVDVFNNTAWGNMHHPNMSGGQIAIGSSDNVRVFNNIAYASGDDRPFQTYGNNVNNQFDYNLHYGGNPSDASTRGSNDVTGVDPGFLRIPTVKPFGAPPQDFGLFDNTDYHTIANFAVGAGSPAIDRGRTLDIERDIEGVDRPQGRAYDIGAYEFVPVSNEKPKLSIIDGEAGESSGAVTVRLRLSAASNESVSVLAATLKDTAINGEDFYGRTVQLQFDPGQTEKSFDVQLIDDADQEPSEQFLARVMTVSGADVAKGVATMTIADDDDGNSVPQFQISGAAVKESAGVANAVISVNPAPTADTSIEVATSAGQARPGADFYGVYRKLQFKAGESRKAVPIEILDDTASEPAETFKLRIFNPSANATIRRGGDTATVTIEKSDG